MQGTTSIRNLGLILVFLAGAAGFALALYAYLTPGSGIDGTGGAQLVVVTSGLVAIAALFLLFADVPGWLLALLLVLILLGALGTGAAAYFLMANWLVGAMVVAFLAALLATFLAAAGGRRSRRTAA